MDCSTTSCRGTRTSGNKWAVIRWYSEWFVIPRSNWSLVPTIQNGNMTLPRKCDLSTTTCRLAPGLCPSYRPHQRLTDPIGVLPTLSAEPRLNACDASAILFFHLCRAREAWLRYNSIAAIRELKIFRGFRSSHGGYIILLLRALAAAAWDPTTPWEPTF